VAVPEFVLARAMNDQHPQADHRAYCKLYHDKRRSLEERGDVVGRRAASGDGGYTNELQYALSALSKTSYVEDMCVHGASDGGECDREMDTC